MGKNLVSVETAELAVEKGYTLPVFGNGYSYHDEDGNEYWTNREKGVSGVENTTKEVVLTKWDLQQWLRDEHNIDLWFGELNKPFRYHVEDITIYGVRVKGITKGSKTYEEALEEGLIGALKLIK